MNSFTLENSFYGYDHGPQTRVYTQDIYRAIGASVAHTLNDYRTCLAQIRSEMVQSRGWLKPIRLKEITGAPAAEVLANEMKEKRRKEKRDAYIRNYDERVAKERKGYSFAPLGAGELAGSASNAKRRVIPR